MDNMADLLSEGAGAAETAVAACGETRRLETKGDGIVVEADDAEDDDDDMAGDEEGTFMIG